jgi:hypothetical protein
MDMGRLFQQMYEEKVAEIQRLRQMLAQASGLLVAAVAQAGDADGVLALGPEALAAAGAYEGVVPSNEGEDVLLTLVGGEDDAED